jgi:hypothetical protein
MGLAFHLNGILIFAWDVGIALGNLVLPNKTRETVIPEGHPGFDGKWPPYVARSESDSRCSCPALNAMANHSIISHDGKDIPFVELNQRLQTTYNLAPTFTLYLAKYVANFLNKDYSKDTLSLAEIDLHDQIEHDGSLIRKLARLVCVQVFLTRT